MIPLSLILALIAVESGGDDAAVGLHGEVGCLQIKPCVIHDVNLALPRPFYKLSDRTNRDVSMQILRRYLARWGAREHLRRAVTSKDLALIWHYGPTGWRRKDEGARCYWAKVRKAMREAQ